MQTYYARNTRAINQLNHNIILPSVNELLQKLELELTIKNLQEKAVTMSLLDIFESYWIFIGKHSQTADEAVIRCRYAHLEHLAPSYLMKLEASESKTIKIPYLYLPLGFYLCEEMPLEIYTIFNSSQLHHHKLHIENALMYYSTLPAKIPKSLSFTIPQYHSIAFNAAKRVVIEILFPKMLFSFMNLHFRSMDYNNTKKDDSTTETPKQFQIHSIGLIDKRNQHIECSCNLQHKPESVLKTVMKFESLKFDSHAIVVEFDLDVLKQQDEGKAIITLEMITEYNAKLVLRDNKLIVE